MIVTTDDKTFCLSGSANFTAAAFDGKKFRNLPRVVSRERSCERVFDGDFTRVSIAPDEFEPGVEQPPEGHPTRLAVIYQKRLTGYQWETDDRLQDQGPGSRLINWELRYSDWENQVQPSVWKLKAAVQEWRSLPSKQN